MTLYADDDFLTTIADQARVVYVTQQVQTCRTTIAHWYAHTPAAVDPRNRARVQYELAYYTKQLERWQSYLTRLSSDTDSCGKQP